MDGERRRARDARRTSLVHGVEEIDDGGAVRRVAEGHRIGAAAGRLDGADLFAPAVLVEQLEAAAGEHRGRLAADDLDALGKAGIACGRRVERADRAVGEAQAGADDVLGLHAVERRRSGKGRDLADRPTRLRKRSSVWIAWVRSTPPPSRSSVPRPGSS